MNVHNVLLLYQSDELLVIFEADGSSYLNLVVSRMVDLRISHFYICLWQRRVDATTSAAVRLACIAYEV